ncbi:MAG: transporter substrate-binding domain-containing protein [Alphaproteobacteria bacterium]|nr:transporter substrate-binding domain-containing protein [Alphaproteobacteria bacterium]
MVKKMKLKFLFLILSLLIFTNKSYAGDLTVNDIKSRQIVVCGTSSDYRSLAYKKNDRLEGFDADICRAFATAIFGNSENFKLVYIKRKNIGKALNSGKIDIMLGHTSLSSNEEVSQNVLPVDTLYYDKQVFVSRIQTKATSMNEFAKNKVCVLKNSNAAIFAKEYNNKHALGFNIIEFPDLAALKEAFYTNRCELASDSEIFINDFVRNIKTDNPTQILPETITYIPIKAYTAGNSTQLNTAFRWIINALKLAYSNGITAQTIETFTSSRSSSIQNLLGINPKSWMSMGLLPEWVKDYINTSGNYMQVMDRNIGKSSKLEIDNPQNELIENGGLLVVQPFI